MTSPRILIIYAHPASHRSRVNRQLAEAARDLPNVTLHDLYETYPDFHINVAHEKALLTNADLVVFQHPIYWYSMPSLLKEWFDVVLEHGWAYGAGRTALHGKGFWSVLTTGSGSDAYQETGEHKHPFAAFLPPFLQTARLCGMRWITPYILHGAHQVDEAVISAHIAEFQKRLSTYPDWTALTDQSTQQITKGEQHGS